VQKLLQEFILIWFLRIISPLIRGIIISNVSFPKILEEEISSGRKSAREILPYLQNSLQELERAGVDCIILPCNTLHFLYEELEKSVSSQFFDLISLVSQEIKEENYRCIGILGTYKTCKEKLYENYLKETELIYPYEEEMQKVSQVIVRILKGIHSLEDKEFMNILIDKLIKRGAQKVLFACTDLGNLIEEDERILDSTSLLIGKMKEYIEEEKN
jgi:aspartate racemase